MNLTRRHFALSSLAAAAAFGGCSRLAATAGEESYRNQAPGYGPLVPDPKGWFDLPQGFSYRVIANAGEVMDDGLLVPDNFDGMGCFSLGGSRIALVRNHELGPGANGRGAAGDDAARIAMLDGLPAFGRDAAGRVLPGGTTTLVYDLATGRREAQYLSLAGTATNCAGGVTPWGSWLTCEETTVAAPVVEQSHGWVFEVPAAHRGAVVPVPLKAMGRFRHEAAAVDPATGVVYLTEDREDGLFYRFIPTVPGKLAEGGRLQALGLVDGGRDSRNWNGADMAPGMARGVRWIELDDVESPADDLRLRGHAAGAVLFARGEGIHLAVDADGAASFYFTATSGGAGRFGQIFRFTPQGDGQGQDAGMLDLFVESTDPRVMDYADNLTVAPWGHLIVCEDRTGNKINHLKGVTGDGRVYTLARLNAETELAGACFSPDGKVLFVNAYAPGRTLAITGPWDALVAA